MTVQNGSVIPARDCSQAGSKSNPLRWDLSPLEIRTTTDGLIGRVKKVYDDIGALTIENVTVENTLKALANVRQDYACKSAQALFLLLLTLHEKITTIQEHLSKTNLSKYTGV